MATIYTKPDGTQVYDFNGQTINAKTGLIYQPAATTASAPNVQTAPSLIPTQYNPASPSSTSQDKDLPPPPPSIPDSLYSSVRQAVQSSTMTPQQAMDYLKSYSAGGKYLPPDPAVLFPAGFQYSQNGVEYKIGQAGNYNGALNLNTGGTSTASGVITATGNPNLDAALGKIGGLVSDLAAGGQIPTTLQITPALVGKFLSWAHAAVDPQTQQLLSAEASNINAAIKNAQTQYENTQAETVQQYGSDLATEQDDAGRNGVAFSGQRNLNEGNMTASANRKLASNASQSAYDIGSLLRSGGEDLGSANTGLLTTPTESGPGQVTNVGGSRGGYTPGANSLDFGYTPSLYTAGKIPSSQNSAVGNLEANYLDQYSTLAATNSNGSRSVNDLLGMITGVPTGQSLTQ